MPRVKENRRSLRPVSGLRMEWATPAASLPTRAIFSVWRRFWRRFSWLSSRARRVRCMFSCMRRMRQVMAGTGEPCGMRPSASGPSSRRAVSRGR